MQCLAACAAAAALYAPQAAVSPTTYQETIPGTLVRFEMVAVPAGAGTVAPFYLGRTEVTWDMYDVFALALDRKTPEGAPDAVARPSRPYGAPDSGWGHAGYPAISIAREAADGRRVTRGGSFRDPLDRLGPAARAVQDDAWNERDPQLPKSQWWLSDGPFVGFRLARSIE